MPTKRTKAKEHIHYHKDGTIWAKGQTTNGVMTGYWEWFRKDGTIMRSGYFENGEQVTEHWDGTDRWHEYTYVREARGRSAVVDPNRTLLLDTNFTNNSRTLAPLAGAAATKWSLKWMVWLQDALLSWGLFA